MTSLTTRYDATTLAMTLERDFPLVPRGEIATVIAEEHRVLFGADAAGRIPPLVAVGAIERVARQQSIAEIARVTERDDVVADSTDAAEPAPTPDVWIAQHDDRFAGMIIARTDGIEVIGRRGETVRSCATLADAIAALSPSTLLPIRTTPQRHHSEGIRL